jgi:hypothetical protein
MRFSALFPIKKKNPKFSYDPTALSRFAEYDPEAPENEINAIADGENSDNDGFCGKKKKMAEKCFFFNYSFADFY